MRYFAIIAMLALVPLHVLAQESTTQETLRPPKVAFVDISAILSKSEAIRAGISDLEVARQDKVRVITRKQRELDRKRYESDLQNAILTEEKKRERRAELIDLSAEIERLQFEILQFEERQDLLLEPVMELVMTTVADTAAQKGFDMVLRGEMVLWGTKPYNLTDSVVEELDRNHEIVSKLFQETAKDEDTDSVNNPSLGNSEPLNLIP